MKLEPIIISLLDTDLYKFNMDQVIFHKHTDLCGQYYFKCRSKGVVFTPEMVQDAPTFKDYWPTIEPLLTGSVIVAHGAGNDLKALAACLRHYKIDWQPAVPYLCTVEACTAVYPDRGAYALGLLDKCGLTDFRRHYPRQLSGGMRQKAALVRTLAFSPGLLLLDEPFSALDYQTRLLLANEVWQIIKGGGYTAVLVTHDISEAIAMSDRVLVFTSRPARLKREFDSAIPPLE